MVAVGVVAGLFGLDAEHMQRLLRESKLAKKGEEILNKNLKAVDLGYQYVAGERAPSAARSKSAIEAGGPRSCCRATRPLRSARWSRAVDATRAIRSRRRRTSWSSWPTSCPKLGGAVVQAEDEIAAIGMVLGASYAGPEGDDRDVWPGHQPDDRDARAGQHGRDSGGRDRLPARRPVDGHADPPRAGRSEPGGLRRARRGPARGAGADQRHGLLLDHGRRVQPGRGVPGARRSSCRTPSWRCAPRAFRAPT